MKNQNVRSIFGIVLVFSLFLSACGATALVSPATSTPVSTATATVVPTATFMPTATPKPTRTPNLAATQRAEERNAEAQKYFDLGYIETMAGEIIEVDDFNYDWAQLGWYNWLPLGESVSDFYISAHFKWSSAYRNANTSGCGIAFAIQPTGDHYAVFLDRSKVFFLNADYSVSNKSYSVGLTRGTGRVKFDNPADAPVEADFTLIVNGAYVYVLVNGEVVGEYSLSNSRILRGDIGLSLLSGTNKDFGTRCEMTDVHLWVPD